MRSLAFLLLVICVLRFLLKIHGQIYHVPCTVQSSDAYRWGTSAAFLAASIGVAIPPQLLVLTPPGAGNAIGTSTQALLRFLWPLIIGANEQCVAEAIREMMGRVEQLTNQKVSNLTLQEIKRWFDGQSDTARKAYEWVPIIRNATDETTKHDASMEYLKALKYLYYSSNDARYTYIEGSVPQPLSFLLIRELAFLQFGSATEIASNSYSPEVVKRKFFGDYQQDVQYYWKAGHVAVERLVHCLPNDQIGKARDGLSMQLLPLYDFSYKFISKNTSAIYTRQIVYKPVVSGDYVALRQDNGQLAVFEDIFHMAPQAASPNQQEACPKCGWDLFDDSYSPNSKNTEKARECGDAVFEITNGQRFGAPIFTCQNVVLNFRRQKTPEEATQPLVTSDMPVFTVSSYNHDSSGFVPCDHMIFDRDRIVLTPTTHWSQKAKLMDAIIIKAN